MVSSSLSYISAVTLDGLMKTLHNLVYYINEFVGLQEALLYANIEVGTSIFPDKAISCYNYTASY